jgi:alpha-2-macroglobulin
MRRCVLLLAALLGIVCATAWADDFNLPGLEADSDAYANSLTARFPAVGTPQARHQAEQAAAGAIRKQDWAAAAAAWETRMALGDASTAQWMALAEAEMRRTPPDATHALQAAWQNFTRSDAGAAEVPALLLMADALKVLDRPAQAIQTLEAAAERAPDDAKIRQALDVTRRASGILVRRVATEPEAEPPRACVAFTVAPARRDDFHAEDWVRLDPPVQGAAVTREGDQICVSGLPSGSTTRIMLRAGMPGESGLSLMKDTSLSVAIANRQPRIDFDTRMFVLPRGQTPALGMTTVNLSGAYRQATIKDSPIFSVLT